MSGSLRVTPQSGHGVNLLRLSGVIDETFVRGGLLSLVKGATVLDLNDVTRITSFGLREWINTMREFPPDYFCFVCVRPMILSQFNMVSNFGGRGELVSFYAPYLCTKCDKEVQILVDLRRQYGLVTGGAPPDALCGDCGGEAVFDDLPDSYFEFVARQPQPSPPAFVQSLIDGTTGGSFRVEKEVTDPVTAIWLHGDLDRPGRLRRVADGLEGMVVVSLAGVNSATADGLGALGTVAGTSGIELVVSSVRPSVLETLSPIAAKIGLKVGSVLLPFRCSKCGNPSEHDIAVADLVRLCAGQTLRSPCPSCKGPLEGAFPPYILEMAAALPLASMPGPIVQFLARSRTTRNDPREGVLYGRYRVVGMLGAGGMGELLLVRQTGLEGFEKMVALKRIKRMRATDPQAVEQLLSEARLAARLSHPNVVQIFDLGKADGEFYIAMEYVRGWDLAVLSRAAMSMKVRWPIEFACRVVSDMCAGLAAAHGHLDDRGKPNPIVHRDVSPQNVLISMEGAVKLADFGIAKASNSTSHTEPGTLRGKIAYISPEQIQSGPVDARADVFSAGVIFYELLAGKFLFRRATDAATLRAILEDPIPELDESIPKELESIMRKVLDRDVARRPSARQLQLIIDEFLSHLGRPATSVLLAEWVRDLVDRAIRLGELPRETAFTPTGSLPTLDRSNPDDVPTSLLDNPGTIDPKLRR